MKLLSKISLSAAAVVVAMSLSVPAQATTQGWDPNAPFNLANQICASGDVAGSIAASAVGAAGQAVALGEAASQLAAGRCKATQAAIDAALAALIAANPGNTRLQAAYNTQRDFVGKGSGNGIKGLWVNANDQISDTMVWTTAGEAVSAN